MRIQIFTVLAVAPWCASAQTPLQTSLQGSVPYGQATAAPLSLSLADAIGRGLKYNLAPVERGESIRSAEASRLAARSSLLPNLSARISQTVEQLNLETFGFSSSVFPIPAIVGPFAYVDLRAYLTQSVFNWSAIKNNRSSVENVRAARFTYQDARDLVVQVVGDDYLQVIASASRVEAAQSQVNTSQALYQQAVDQNAAGVNARIDVLRAQVQLQTEQQRLVAQTTQFEKNKLALARAIGLPAGQDFTLSDALPYAPLTTVNLDQLLKLAYQSRPDLQSAMAQVRAAELARQAAAAERLPSLDLNADYGDIGTRLSNSHGTFSVTGGLRIPIFQGGRAHADILQADALLQQRKSEEADLRGRIDYEVRTALLDLRSAADQVEVAAKNVDLAGQTLAQARDRFAAGVTDNIEVVQAQQSVAAANENYISSVYSHNVAKVELARALGGAEEGVRQYLKGN